MVASAGDYNGDGHAAFWSVPFQDSAGSNAGRLYLFSGANIIDDALVASDADIILDGETEGDQFGWSFSGGGDIDGDEKAEIIVSAPYNDEFGSAIGKIYILSGNELTSGTASLSNASWTFFGENPIDSAGTFVASAGNIDDDSYDDILIGAKNHDSLGVNKAGKVYLFRGSSLNSPLLTSPTPLTDADFAFLGESPEDLLHKATVAGDVEEMVWMMYCWPLQIVTLVHKMIAVYLVSGANITSGSFVVSDADAIYVGSNFDEQAGYSIAGGGDHDGDGFDDLLIGAIGGAQNGDNSGTIYVITDAAMQTSTVSLFTAPIQLIGEEEGDMAGFSIAPMGDIDGDGMPEVLIGPLTMILLTTIVVRHMSCMAHLWLQVSTPSR